MQKKYSQISNNNGQIIDPRNFDTYIHIFNPRDQNNTSNQTKIPSSFTKKKKETNTTILPQLLFYV